MQTSTTISATYAAFLIFLIASAIGAALLAFYFTAFNSNRGED
jgi:hypothetical protein